MKTRSTLIGGLCLILLGVLTVTAVTQGESRVAEAAMKGERDSVRTLLKQGVDVNAPQGDGMTALHWAAYKDDLEMAQMLVYAGAKAAASLRINAMTPLFFACQNGNAGMVELLLKAGADPNAALKNGATPLMYGSRAGDAQVVRLLLDKGASPNTVEPGRGETALMFAAASNRAEAIQVLLSHGARATATTKVLDIAARNAAARGPARGARAGGAVMEERPPDVSTMGGMTALLFAARQGHAEAVKALIDGGADINGRNAGDQATPLLTAVINGHFDLAMWLLSKGADGKLASTAGATPLYATINLKWALVAEYPQPETKNEKTSHLELMKALLDRGADPNVQIKNELWYTGFASSRTQIDAAGATPLWRASQSSDVPAMRLLINRGADPRIKSFNGQTPLHIAAGAGVHGNQEVTALGSWMPGVRYLVEELGAAVNEKDGKGLTALHHAAARGDNDMIVYLVAKGADPTVVGKAGETIADMANGPRQRIQPFYETVALLQLLGSKNSHKCVSC